jgi:hypothetical protein
MGGGLAEIINHVDGYATAEVTGASVSLCRPDCDRRYGRRVGVNGYGPANLYEGSQPI